MNYELICSTVSLLHTEYGQPDPESLCSALDILLLREPMGTSPDAIKGFYLEVDGVQSITINIDLPTIVQRVVISHELGHALLHRSIGVHAFHEIGLFDQHSLLEREANLFAAEYLLEDEEVLTVLNSDTTFSRAAAELFVPVELLDFKFRALKWKGYKLCESPIQAHNNFLKDLKVPQHDNFI